VDEIMAGLATRQAAAGRKAKPTEIGLGTARVTRAKPGPRYMVRKEEGVWRVVFEGKEGVVRDHKGMPLAVYLLKNPPPVPIHAMVLEMAVWAAEDPSGVISEVVTDDASDGETVDDMAYVQQARGAKLNAGANVILRAKVRKLLQTKADETLPPSEREAAAEKLDEIHAALLGKAGRGKDAASLAVDRVRKALTRLHENLTQPSRDRHERNLVLDLFADHLEQYLLIPSARFSGSVGSRNRAGVAGTFTYEPPPGVIWMD
jgi:hypothetical protein